MQDTNELQFLYALCPGDEKIIRRITHDTGFFSADEVDIAEELAAAHRKDGAEKSGYYFMTAAVNGNIAAYTCYGPIPGSDTSYDLYWIVTDAAYRGQGIGKRLLAETERTIAAAKGKNLYAETSSTILYTPTRAFYEHCGYVKEAVLKDFYRNGDDKVFYVKRLSE